MTDLEPFLQRLGLQQYFESFIAEGFETWETVLDIQESDLEALNVRLGHRRKLQRAIAEYRGVSNDRPLGLQPQDAHNHEGSRLEPAALHASYSKDANQPGPVDQKRKYRRHPKPDEHAPEKPPSAYVLFSNRIREEVKSDNLSFTEIARLVGERWQKLDPAQKELFEAHAASLKEAYNTQLTEYKKTESYKEYSQYLADFKAKHDTSGETKRPKLEQHTSSSFSTTSGGEVSESAHQSSGHTRGNSIESASTASLIGGTSTLHLATSATPTACRESSPHYTSQDRRLLGQASDQSSLSEESASTRTDQADTVSRTANVSIGMLPVGTPPSSATSSRSQRLELGHSHLTQPWPQRQSAYSYPIPATSGPSPSATPSVHTSGEQWRDRSANTMEARSFNVGQPTSPIPISQLVGHEPGLTASQRTLPPLRQPTGIPRNVKFTGFGPSSTSAPADPYYPQNEVIALRQAGRHQPGRSETEAADILAALAERQQHFDERKTPQHWPDPR